MNRDEFEKRYYNWKYRFDITVSDRDGEVISEDMIKGDWEDLIYLIKNIKKNI